MSDAIRDMSRAVRALSLELPASVFQDVDRHWRAVLAENARLQALATERLMHIARLEALFPDGVPDNETPSP